MRRKAAFTVLAVLLMAGCPRNHAPHAPSAPSGPSVVVKDSLAEFSASATDPDGDSLCIRFYWGDGFASAWSTMVQSGDTVRTTHAWQVSDDFRVAAQAEDEKGLTSSWSSSSTVTITTRLKWRCQTDSFITSDPTVGADGTVYVGSYDHYLYAVSPDGSLRWRCQTSSFIISSPAVGADGTVYVGSDDHCLYAVSPDGSLRWRCQTNSYIISDPAVGADGTVYVGSDGLYAINPDGSLKWRYQTGGDVSSSPAVAADGTVYVGSYDHFLYAINPDGSLKWRCKNGGRILSSPAVTADGTVYVGSYDGCLYAIDGDSPLADSPWPKFHHDNKNTGRVGGGQR